MSFCIVTYVREGIIMAADSRITYNKHVEEYGVRTRNFGVSYNESTNKLFLSPNGVGISICGEADIYGVPISGFIESFITEKIVLDMTVEDTALQLLDYFKSIKMDLNTYFFVAGYIDEAHTKKQVIYKVHVLTDLCERRNDPEKQGVEWGGETNTFARLIQPMALKLPDGSYRDLETPERQFGHFTLQDAVDFSMFAVRTTIDDIRFQLRNKTVGGPIDVLVIKPTEIYWLRKKTLEVK